MMLDDDDDDDDAAAIMVSVFPSDGVEAITMFL